MQRPSCPWCGGQKFVTGQCVGSEGPAPYFVPTQTRRFRFKMGVSLTASFSACLACGHLWGAVAPGSLRSFIEQYGTEVLKQDLACHDASRRPASGHTSLVRRSCSDSAGPPSQQRSSTTWPIRCSDFSSSRASPLGRIQGIMGFDVIGEITDIEIFAVGSAIRELARLRRIYGPGRWRKRKGIGRVRLEDGSSYSVELHWYKAPWDWPRRDENQAVIE